MLLSPNYLFLIVISPKYISDNHIIHKFTSVLGRLNPLTKNLNSNDLVVDVNKETEAVFPPVVLIVQARSMTIPRHTLEALLFPMTAEIKG